jgi:hypothetical protein
MSAMSLASSLSSAFLLMLERLTPKERGHDTGGKVGAAVHLLDGKSDVLEFAQRFLHRVWSRYRWTITNLNGARGMLLEHDGKITAAVSVGYDDSAKAAHIFIMQNPDKLARLARTTIR